MKNIFLAQSARCVSRCHELGLRRETEKMFAWTEQFSTMYFQSRIQRALDIDSAEVGEVQKYARQYIGANCHDFFATCVDGRNMPVVMFSKAPHVGGVLRSPAGTVTGFMAGQQPDSVYIDYDSLVVQQIRTLLKQKSGDTIYYGLDSHLACAARGQIHATEGGRQTDGGLRADILNKLMTAHGLVQLQQELAETSQDAADIIPVFFSFDPHTGCMYIGLELYVDDPQVASEGYTQRVLDDLVSQHKILSTHHLLTDTRIASLLGKEMKGKRADFRTSYRTSILENWRAITALYADGKGEVYKTVESQLNAMYARSDWSVGAEDSTKNKQISDKTIKQKAKFVLKNLVTRYSVARTDDHWPYDTHCEEMIVITDGGYAPFPSLDAFAVFSKDLTALLSNTKLTINLIRDGRRGGKIPDPVPHSQLSSEEFISAPVVISSKAILHLHLKESWKTLATIQIQRVFEQIQWDDQKTQHWRKSDIESLMMNHMRDHHIVLDMHDTLEYLQGIYTLFDRVRIMMKDKYFRQMILCGHIVVLHTLVDEHRMPYLLVPFVI